MIQHMFYKSSYLEFKDSLLSQSELESCSIISEGCLFAVVLIKVLKEEGRTQCSILTPLTLVEGHFGRQLKAILFLSTSRFVKFPLITMKASPEIACHKI